MKLLQFIRFHWVFICLFLLVLFGGFLRFYRLREIPVSNYWDGVASSYNAYSILRTGRDEYGYFMPLLFRSFNDYKMPANIYLTVPYVAVWGLNGFSTRGSTATAGTLLILLTFFLTKELLEHTTIKKNKIAELIKKHRDLLALLSSFFVAISPWAIQFSRAEFEANVGVPFIVMGILFFLKGIRVKKPWIFFIGLISFSVSVYFYRSIIFFTPAIIILLTIIYFKKVIANKYFIVALFVFGLLALPMYLKVTSKEGRIRSEQVSVFTNSFNQTLANAKKQDASGNTFLAKILYNRRIVYAEIIAQNYFVNFSPDFLFFKGDPNNSRHGPRGMGLLYLWEILFVLLGVFLMWKLGGKFFWVLLSWILISPIPAAVSIPNPHALRMLNILPVPQLLTAMGVLFIGILLKGKMRYVYAGMLVVVISIFFVLFQQNFYGYSARVSSSDWADGYKQLYMYLFQHENQYDTIVVTGHWWKPYIYYLYYKKYDPATFQKHYSQTHIGKYLFGGTRWEAGQHELDTVSLRDFAKEKQVLVALSPDEYHSQKDHIHVLQLVYNHNNELVFIVGKLL